MEPTILPIDTTHVQASHSTKTNPNNGAELTLHEIAHNTPYRHHQCGDMSRHEGLCRHCRAKRKEGEWRVQTHADMRVYMSRHEGLCRHEGMKTREEKRNPSDLDLTIHDNPPRTS